MTIFLEAIRIFLFMIFALFGSILWFYIKNILSEKGYKVSWYHGHFDDLNEFSNLIDKTVDQNERKNYKLILRGLIAIIVLSILTALTFLFDLKNFSCDSYKDFLKKEVSGIVVDKFVDKPNHNFQTIVIEKNGKNFNDIDLSIHNSGFFDSVRVGDLIQKIKGDSITYLQRNKIEVIEFRIHKKDYCQN